jgi:hypothetical protein
MRIAELIAVTAVVACAAPPTSTTAPGDRPAPTLASPGDPRMTIDPLLQRASSGSFATYDPGAVIAAVNALVGLGHERALATLDGFIARQDLTADPHHGLFLVLRVAFEANPHPPVQLGGSRPPPPAAPDALPRFPIMMVDDVPVMLVASYALRGLPEPVTAHLAYYRAHGRLRSAPLAPPAGRDRVAGHDAQYRAAYHAAPSDAEREHVRAQLARL